MMEAMIWKEIVEHWPSIATGVMVAAVYMRLAKFAVRQQMLEKRVRRLMEVCSEQHPEKAKKLFDDGNGGNT